MIDWHSHVLPKMDDGSRSVAESMAMLRSLQTDGVSCVIATPHFYANHDSVNTFLKRRQECFETLLSSMYDGAPELRLGAEVKYYSGISKMEGLQRLTVDNTNILLLEMPMARWTEYTVKEILALAASGTLTVVLAHVERYIGFQHRGTLERLCDGGVLVQVNAGSMQTFGNRRRIFKLFDAGLVHFIGSDCHDLTTRPPCMAGAYDRIAKRFGTSYVRDMISFGQMIIKQKERNTEK